MIYILFIAFAVIFVDRVTKVLAQKHLKERRIRKGWLTFGLVENPGAYKGLFKEKPRFLLLLQTAGVALAFVLTVSFHLIYRNKWLTAGLALLAGGGVGNLIDRLRTGKVTDFFAVKWTKNLYYNLADLAIFTGGVLLIAFELFMEIKKLFGKH